MTGINDITRFIQANPSGLRLGDDEAAFGEPQVVAKAVASVLNLYRESHKFHFDKRDRQKLERRLLIAATRLQELIEYEELEGSPRDKKLACEHQKLFAEIATQLGMDPQQLQQRTLERV